MIRNRNNESNEVTHWMGKQGLMSITNQTKHQVLFYTIRAWTFNRGRPWMTKLGL
jgi:hypothetical protein